jgi:hypothetical protein
MNKNIISLKLYINSYHIKYAYPIHEFNRKVFGVNYDKETDKKSKYYCSFLDATEPKKLPSADKFEIQSIENSYNKLFRAEVKSNVPGSKAFYEKSITPEGKTIKYIKTTYDPDGKVGYIKNKLKSE